MDPSKVVNIGTPALGVLREVTVERGEFVEAGATVATILSNVETASRDLAKVQADNSAEIDALASRLQLSQKQLARAQKLTRNKVVTQQRLEEAEAAVIADRAQLAEARQRKKVAEMELLRAETVLAMRTIRSPISGIVTARNLSAGEYADQNAEIATIAQLDPLYIEAFLPVDMYGKLAVGDRAKVVPAPPLTGEHMAEVIVIDRVFDAASATFGVRLRLPNSDQALPAGHRCEVEF